nr:hypothetical protein [Tanacetum cinerariifolium]
PRVISQSHVAGRAAGFYVGGATHGAAAVGGGGTVCSEHGGSGLSYRGHIPHLLRSDASASLLLGAAARAALAGWAAGAGRLAGGSPCGGRDPARFSLPHGTSGVLCRAAGIHSPHLAAAAFCPWPRATGATGPSSPEAMTSMTFRYRAASRPSRPRRSLFGSTGCWGWARPIPTPP